MSVVGLYYNAETGLYRIVGLDAADAGRHAGGGQPRRAVVASRPRARVAHRAVAVTRASGHAAAMSESSLRGLALLPHVRRLIELALDEDLGRGDVTTAATVGHAEHSGDLRRCGAARQKRRPPGCVGTAGGHTGLGATA